MRRQLLAWADIAVVEGLASRTLVWSQSAAGEHPSAPTQHLTLSPVAAYLKQPTLVDFPGRLAAIFFLSGCNFRCGYCHNAALLAVHREGMPWDRVEHACVHFRRHWADGVVITGGEPTLTPGLPDLIQRLKRHGFAVKLDTNGSRPDVLAAVLPEVDYVAMDIKCSLESYERLTGFAATDLIARSLELIRTHARAYELRTTVLEDLHTAEELQRMGRWIRGAHRLVLQPFLPREDLPDPARRRAPRTSPGCLRVAAELLRPQVREVICRD